MKKILSATLLNGGKTKLYAYEAEIETISDLDKHREIVRKQTEWKYDIWFSCKVPMGTKGVWV